MLLSTLRNTPSRYGPDHVVPTFNAEQGIIIRATLRDIQAEAERLRACGISDEGVLLAPRQQVIVLGDPPTDNAIVTRPPEEVPAPTRTDEVCSVTNYANRAELIRHLSSGAATAARPKEGTSSTACHVHAVQHKGSKRKAEDVVGIESTTAVASSTHNSAVGTRAGPGGPLHEAGATAAAATHQCGVAAAAVTADCLVVALASDDMATSDPPPTVAPHRWTAERTPRAPGRVLPPRQDGQEDPDGDGQHTRARTLQADRWTARLGRV
jgi:hypothetical protein